MVNDNSPTLVGSTAQLPCPKCGHLKPTNIDCKFCGVFADKEKPKRLPCRQCGYSKIIGEPCFICSERAAGRNPFN